MDAREFAEWVAYDRMSPIGPERIDTLNAHVVQTLNNVNRGKHQTPMSLQDAMLIWESVPPTAAELEAKIRARTRAITASRAKRG